MKECRNHIISLKYKLEESNEKNKTLLDEIEIKQKKLIEIENSKNELESKLEVNKEVLELLSALEQNQEEEFDIKGTVENYFKQQDGVRSLTNFIFVLNRRIRDYQEEVNKRILSILIL